MHKIGEAIEYLDGLYVSAEDVGTTVAEMRGAAEKTSHIASLAASGDPSPWTAFGVMSCINAALDYTGHSLSSAWIEGLGKVGWDLAHRFHAVGAELYVSDLRPELVVKAVENFPQKDSLKVWWATLPCMHHVLWDKSCLYGMSTTFGSQSSAGLQTIS